MKTKQAEALANSLLIRKQDVLALASQAAHDYARTDNKASKAAFEAHNQTARMLDEIHTITCQTLHAIEAMIPEAPNEQ